MEKTEKNVPKQLAPIGDLFKRAWAAYKNRMWALLAVGLVAILLPVVVAVPFVFLGFTLAPLMPEMDALVMGVCAALGAMAAVWMGNWGVSAFLMAVADQRCGVKKAFRVARPKTLAQIWLGVITGLILTGAHLLLIIPGIIFSVWFFFAPFVFIEEDERGLSALLKSKEYVRGRWVPVLLRLLVIWLFSVAVCCIPVLGQLLALFLVPFSVVYTHLIYKNLKETRGASSWHPSRQEKITVVAAGAVGLALPVVMVFVFVGSMSLMPFSMLKASVTGTSHSPGVVQKTTGQPGGRAKTTFSVKAQAPATTPNVNQDKSMSAEQIQIQAKATAPAAQETLKGVEPAKEVPQQGPVNPSGPNPGVQPNGEAARAQETPATAIATAPSTPAKQEEKASAAAAAMPQIVLSGQETKEVRDIIETCNKAIQIQPSDSLAYHNRGVAQFKLGNYQEAIKDFTFAIQHNPQDGAAYYNRAIAYGLLGNHKEAIEDGVKAAQINPNNAGTYVNRGIDYMALGKLREAEADFTKAIECNPKDSAAYYARAVVNRRLGAEKKATADFIKASQLGSKKAKEYLKALEGSSPS
jgi:Flp pilus assembly protein TadD